jgi:chromate transport protein ChrA
MKNPPANEMAHGMAASRTPRIRDLVIYFLRLGTFGFGDPVAAVIALVAFPLLQPHWILVK